MVGNATDDLQSPYSAYSLPSDSSRFVAFSFNFDRDTLNPLYRIPAFTSIAFGLFILIHSAFLHKREVNFVRFCCDFAALNMCLAAALTFLALYKPNATKLVLCLYVFGTGTCAYCIQLCDMYMFYNRLLAVTKIPKWKRVFTHIYIYAIITGPYYSLYLWIPLFYDLNSDGYYLSYFLLALNAWGTIVFNVYFTFEFIYVLYSIYYEKDFSSGSPNRTITLIVIKSLLHFLTSTVANLLYSYHYIFNVDEITFWFFYNMVICFGLHFFFNVKNDEFICSIINCFFGSCAYDISSLKTTTNEIMIRMKNSKRSTDRKRNSLVAPERVDEPMEIYNK